MIKNEKYIKKILKDLNFEKYKAVSRENKSGSYKYCKAIFRNKMKGQGIEKTIKAYNIIDIYTRLDVLLGLEVCGHADNPTEASNLIDELYKRGEIQNKQQNRNAPNKFSSH